MKSMHTEGQDILHGPYIGDGASVISFGWFLNSLVAIWVDQACRWCCVTNSLRDCSHFSRMTKRAARHACMHLIPMFMLHNEAKNMPDHQLHALNVSQLSLDHLPYTDARATKNTPRATRFSGYPVVFSVYFIWRAFWQHAPRVLSLRVARNGALTWLPRAAVAPKVHLHPGSASYIHFHGSHTHGSYAVCNVFVRRCFV